MDKDNGYDNVVSELRETYIKKNHDYGSSFSKSFAEFCIISAVVRMSDKMERLKSLCHKDAAVAESIRDTVMDLANYAIMCTMELDKVSDNKKKQS